MVSDEILIRKEVINSSCAYSVVSDSKVLDCLKSSGYEPKIGKIEEKD